MRSPCCLWVRVCLPNIFVFYGVSKESKRVVLSRTFFCPFLILDIKELEETSYMISTDLHVGVFAKSIETKLGNNVLKTHTLCLYHNLGG
jgi:hypothetical protein